jgi:cyclopropane fatty-acyl-phospholipid synthase-like methyltransferase
MVDSRSTAMAETERAYIPAAGHDWLLRFYDPLTKLLGTEAAHRELVAQARLQAGHRVLEIGCGTGALIVLVKRLCPTAIVVGLDPDPRALARARQKAERAGVSIQLDRGFADQLPYADGSFDRVLSAFMLHHLTVDEKKATLWAARRVLAPGGSVHVVDFAGGTVDGGGLLARVFHGAEKTPGDASIPTLMRAAGFTETTEVLRRMTFFRIGFYGGSVPRGA